MSAPLRWGMVGGGAGAFIGAVHRMAARLDGDYALVAAALSSDPATARDSGAALGLAPDRVYADYAQMARAEAARPDGVQVVSIVTPNHLHLDPALAFLAQGIAVICEKPLTATLADARRLHAVARDSGAPFLLAHTYAGYAMLRQARAMVQSGALGALRVVQVEYAQDWLAAPADPANRQAAWRTDPARSGPGGSIGDIGTHAFHALRYVTGLRCTALAADLTAFVEGRRVDDNAQVMLRLDGGARGAIWASQVAVGCENGFRLRVFGAEGGLEWAQEDPNILWFTPRGGPRQRLTRGGPGHHPAPGWDLRAPAGHPEGYVEAFATLYRDFARVLRGAAPVDGALPGVDEGLEGVRFVDAAVRSSMGGGAWVAFDA